MRRILEAVKLAGQKRRSLKQRGEGSTESRLERNRKKSEEWTRAGKMCLMKAAGWGVASRAPWYRPGRHWREWYWEGAKISHA